MGRTIAALLITLAAASCTVGPAYKRPPVDMPGDLRGQPPDRDGQTSFGDEQWAAVFQDPTLQELIRAALQRNPDVRIAAVRILEAQSQLGITRADQFPAVTGGAAVFGERTAAALGFGSNTAHAVSLTASAQWEIDFWGRYRRATEAARAQLTATEWGRRAVVSTLVSEVAAGYFGLRALDLELDVAERTLASRRDSLRLTEVRERGGVASLVDVRQAEQLVYGATSAIAVLQREIEQQENFLSELLGNNPGAVPRGRPLTDQPHAPEIPVGLPSALLERRPDIQQAEQRLVAANAAIGVARAAYFPQIALTGSGGWESAALTTLLTGTNAIWTAAAALTQPVFTAGRTRSQVALAVARRDEAAIAYEQTVRHAFREVSDALVAYRKTRDLRDQEALLLASAQQARRLAQTRYEGGVTSYLEVLDSDTRQFEAELGFVQAQLGELSALVEIYRALGGGWQS